MTYRLRLVGSDDHYFRRRNPDSRHGYARYWVVTPCHREKPTEWRTAEAAAAFLARHPYWADLFEIEEIA